jgi:hypothetical protein
MLNFFQTFNVRTFIRAATWGPVILFFVEHGFSIGSIQGRSMQVSCIILVYISLIKFYIKNNSN